MIAPFTTRRQGKLGADVSPCLSASRYSHGLTRRKQESLVSVGVAQRLAVAAVGEFLKGRADVLAEESNTSVAEDV